MESGEQRIQHYIERLAGKGGEDAWHSLVEDGPDALPFIEDAFASEQRSEVRTLLIEAIGEIRQPASVTLLAKALTDPVPAVWKAAIDALVKIGGPDSKQALLQALDATPAREKDARVMGEWIADALAQLRER